MFKAVKFVAVPASMGFATLRVLADSETKIPPKTLIRVDELSLYSSPVKEATFIEEKQTGLEGEISWLRKSVAPYTSWCQDVYKKAKPKVETAVEHSKVTYELLRDAPPGFYPRLGLIGLAGVVGLFLARGKLMMTPRTPPTSFFDPCTTTTTVAPESDPEEERDDRPNNILGSRIKKLVYPLGFMGIGASLYYPQQAVTIATGTGTVLYDWSLQGFVTLESLWKDGGKKKSPKKSEKPVTPDSPVRSDLSSAEEKTQLETSEGSK